MLTWRNDNETRSVVKIISDKELGPATTAVPAKMTITGTATIDLLRVNAQPVINLRKLLRLKHNQQ